MEVNIRKSSLGSLFLVIGMSPLIASAEPTGEDIYFQSCTMCHGDDGTGAMPGIPDLSGADGPLWKPQDDLLAIIMNGSNRSDLPTPMPAKGGNDDLTPEKAWGVIEFMRREFGN